MEKICSRVTISSYMNKLHLITGTILFFLVCSIFFITQKDSLFSGVKPSAIPTLPPDNLFATIIPDRNSLQDPYSQQGALQAQRQQAAQQQAQQQQQQAAQQQVVPTAGVEEPIPATVSAKIVTVKGTIVLKLFGDKAPNTVKNFITKVRSGFYKGLKFHRVEDWVIQGGDPQGNGTGGGQMATELNDIPFVRGSLGVARGSNRDLSNDSQFFITKKDSSHLNNDYTNFGTVESGLDVVDKIAIGDIIQEITIEKN